MRFRLIALIILTFLIIGCGKKLQKPYAISNLNPNGNLNVFLITPYKGFHGFGPCFNWISYPAGENDIQVIVPKEFGVYECVSCMEPEKIDFVNIKNNSLGGYWAIINMTKDKIIFIILKEKGGRVLRHIEFIRE